MKKLQLIFLFIYFAFFHSLSADNNKQTDSLLKVTETAKDTALVNTLLRIVSIYKSSNEDAATYYLNKAEKEATKINFDEGYSNALFMHGDILYFNYNYSEALDYFTRCLEFSEKRNNKLLKAKCLERLASLHLATDDPNLALKLYYESLVIFEEINDRKGIAKVYNILGIYKADTEEFDMAEVYLNKSLRIHQELNDKHNIIENKVNLGYLYERIGNIEKAEKIYIQLIPEIKESGDMHALSVIYFNLASIYQKKEEATSALDFLYKAIGISEQTGDTALLSSLYGNTAELLIKTGDVNSARVLLNKSVLCSRSIGDMETEIQALKFVAYIDSLAGDFTSAFSTYKLISSLKDTLNKRKCKNCLKKAELQYENQKSQSKIALQEKIILTDKRNKLLFIILFIISSAASLLLIWLFILQKKSLVKNKKLHDQQIRLKQLELEKVQNEEKLQKLEKEKIEDELRLKERELVSSALLIDQRNEELNYVRQKIKDLINQDFVNISELKELDKIIKLKLKDYDNWDLFNKAFNNVHIDFSKNLKDKHPDLTRTELKYCAYNRIHLSSYQISSLLNVTIEAIRKTRYRLRKKLNLKSTDSLDDYIIKF